MSTHHEWGDKDFNWEELQKAQDYISNMYNRIYKRRPIIKEKYGSLVYEFIPIWVTSYEQFKTLIKILFKATEKFPDVAAEIVEDIIEDYEDDYINAHVQYFKLIVSLNAIKSLAEFNEWRKEDE